VHGGAHGHAAHHPKLQHHFETMEQQKEASTLGMWVFLLTEVLFFGGLFFAYMLYRVWYFDAFAEASRSLGIGLGAFNTAVLIGSSLTMALAVRAAQTSERKATVTWLILTILLGCVFLGVKVVEYADKFEHHHVPGAHYTGWSIRLRWGGGRGRRGVPPRWGTAEPGARAAAERHADLLQPVFHDDGPARAPHDHRHRADDGDHMDGLEGQVRRAVLHAG
jgi:hypothetical protein